jgi:hypothetical protein
VAIILARSLLWAAFEPETVLVNDVAISIITSDLRKKIMDTWTNSGRRVDDVNSVKKIGFLVSQ